MFGGPRQSTNDAKVEKLINAMKNDSLPTLEELYENPIDTITITPRWYEIEDDYLDFIDKLFSGYLWEVKHGTAFIARHPEQREVENVLYRIHHIRHMDKEQRWIPNRDSDIALLLVDIARLIPRMWD